jgi:hypothetical protein
VVNPPKRVLRLWMFELGAVSKLSIAIDEKIIIRSETKNAVANVPRDRLRNKYCRIILVERKA